MAENKNYNQDTKNEAVELDLDELDTVAGGRGIQVAAVTTNKIASFRGAAQKVEQTFSVENAAQTEMISTMGTIGTMGTLGNKNSQAVVSSIYVAKPED